MLFLDLKKAFDTVDHSILLHKLEHIGVKQEGVNWVKSYLTDRQQVTKVSHSISNKASVNCGVPQGSILGPLLFTLYINDLPSVVPDINMNLYADDTAITVCGHSSVEIEWKLNQTLKLVAAWFSYNKLSLNLNKTNFMLFGTHQTCKKYNNVMIRFGETNIKRVEELKYLGMMLDPQLTFSAHVNYIRKKTLGKIKLLGRLSYVISQNLAASLYTSLILPIYDNG